MNTALCLEYGTYVPAAVRKRRLRLVAVTTLAILGALLHPLPAFADGPGPNPAYKWNPRAVDGPVDTATGNRRQVLPGIGVGGRGPGLSFAPVYNSDNRSLLGPLGYGWTFLGQVSLTAQSYVVNGQTVSQRTVVQEGGSMVIFTLNTSNGNWESGNRFRATLVEDNVTGKFTFTRNYVEKFVFNPQGKLISQQDANGVSVTHSRDAGGRLMYSEDAVGRRLIYTYGREAYYSSGSSGVDGGSGERTEISPPIPDTLITRVDGPEGQYVILDYNDLQQLTALTNAKGHVWNLQYDTLHRLEDLRTPRFANQPGVSVKTRYYSNHRVKELEDELGRVTTFDYTSVAGATKISRPSTATRLERHVNSANGVPLLTEVVIGYGSSSSLTTTYGRNLNTQAINSVKDPANKTTTYIYNQFTGHLMEELHPVTGSTVFTPDELGRIIVTRNREQIQTYTYNDGVAGNPTISYVMDNNANELTRTEYKYDNPDRRGEPTAFKDARNYTWTLHHNTAGDFTGFTDPDTKRTKYEYDSIGRRTAVVTPLKKRSETHYDVIGHVWKTIEGKKFDITGTTIVHPGYTTLTEYDANGNVTKVTDPRDNATRYEYNNANELIKVIHPDLSYEEYAYWPNGKMRFWRDANGQIWNYNYDMLDRLSSVVDPRGDRTSYTYTAAGHLATVGYRNTVCRDYNYERKIGEYALPDCVVYRYSGNQMYSEYRETNEYCCHRTNAMNSTNWTPQSPEFYYEYDPMGRLKSIERRFAINDWDGPWHKINFTYDALGRLKKRYESGNPGNPTDLNYSMPSGDIEYDYYKDGSIKEITYPSASGTKKVTYTYDSVGRMDSVKDWADRTTTFHYDPDSNWERTQFPAGTGNTDIRAYTDAGLPQLITWKKGSSVLGEIGYNQNGNGQVSYMSATGLPGVAQTYLYDNRNRLETNNGATFTYDPAGNMTSRPLLPVPGYQTSVAKLAYNTDSSLCFTSPTTGGTPGPCYNQPADATSYYTYGNGVEADEPYNPVDPNWECDEWSNCWEVWPRRAHIYERDLMPERYSGYLGLDSRRNTEVSVKYFADALGARIGRLDLGTNTVPNSTTAYKGTRFVYSGAGGQEKLLATRNEITGDTYLLYGPGGTPIAQIQPNGSIFYLHQDHLGSTRLVTNSSGDAIATFSYDAYGQLTGSTGTFKPVLGWVGEYKDEESGLVYLRARMYNPKTGSFLTRDPALARTGQPYGYANGDPINNVDPSGEIAVPLVLAAVGALIGGGLTVASGNRDPVDIGLNMAFGAFSGAYLAPRGVAQLARWGIPKFFAHRAAFGFGFSVTGQYVNVAQGDQSQMNWGSALVSSAFAGFGGLANASLFTVARSPLWKLPALSYAVPGVAARQGTAFGASLWGSIYGTWQGNARVVNQKLGCWFCTDPDLLNTLGNYTNGR